MSLRVPPPKPAPRPFEIPVGPAPPPRTDLIAAAQAGSNAAANAEAEEEDEDEEVWDIPELSEKAIAEVAQLLQVALTERYAGAPPTLQQLPTSMADTVRRSFLSPGERP